jgi:hypothetical protein
MEETMSLTKVKVEYPPYDEPLTECFMPDVPRKGEVITISASGKKFEVSNVDWLFDKDSPVVSLIVKPLNQAHLEDYDG